jgi:hypothetical protein
MTPEPGIPEYRLAWRDPADASELALVAGRRVAVKGQAVAVGNELTKESLANGRAVPVEAGGGFAFWTHRGVYAASDFLGPLRMISGTPFQVSDVSFGPGFWLLRASDGSRMAVDPETGARVRFNPPGLVDVAMAPDGRVVAVVEPGRALVSTDRGASYRDVTSELSGTLAGLATTPLGFVVEGGAVLSPGRDGALSAEAFTGSSEDGLLGRRRMRVKRNEPPTALVEALRNGLLQGPGRALVALGSSVAEVDLRSGKVLSRGPQLLPGTPSCELLRASSEVLMRCSTEQRLVFLSRVQGTPVVERTFQGNPRVHDAYGQLLVESSCDGQKQPLTVCVRHPGGEWKQLGKREATGTGGTAGSGGSGGGSAAPADPPLNVEAYAPRSDGGAVGLVRSGALTGYVDLASGKRVALTGAINEAFDNRSRCQVGVAGALRCLTSRGLVTWDADGKEEPRLYRFSALRLAGERALGTDSQNRLFQTLDFGRTWQEVAGPPALGTGGELDGCSEVGCVLGEWLRTGWEPTQAEPVERIEPLPTPVWLPPVRPKLRCTSLAPAEVKLPSPTHPLTRQDDDSVATQAVWGLGLQELKSDRTRLTIESSLANASEGVATRGVISSRYIEYPNPQMPEMTLVKTEPVQVHYVNFFDALARPLDTSTPFHELVRAAQRIGLQPPGDISEDDAAAAVLSAEPSKPSGMIVSFERARLWLDGQRTVVLDPTPEGWVATSAVAERSGSLVLLLTDEDGTSRLWRYRQGRGMELSKVPRTSLRTATETPDAVAIAESGEPVAVRFPSGTLPPTADDPALVLAPGKPAEALAPWDTLVLGSDPACAGTQGYRVLVSTTTPWLAVEGERSADDGWGMLAQLRWSRDRVCLESVELPLDDYVGRTEEPAETRLVLREFPKPLAGRVGFAPGFEVRQALDCELAKP